MGAHCHHHHHHETKNFKWAFLLNFSFTIIEVIGGFWTGSLAILADAVHDFGDSLALAFAWYAEKLAHKQQTTNSKFTYGFTRFRTISALINGTILFAGSLGVAYASISFLVQQNFQPIASDYMTYLAILGVLVNGFAVTRLSSNGVNSKMMRLHLLEDTLGWVVVLVGAIVIWTTGWFWIDSVLSLGLSFYIGFHAFKNLREVYYILMQRSPFSIEKIKSKLEQFPEVESVCDMHFWTLDGDNHIASIHLISKEESFELNNALKQKVRGILSEIGHCHATIEIESVNFPCQDKC